MKVAEDKNMKWRVVAETKDLSDNGLLDVLIDGKLILLAETAEQLYALQGQCPHQFARLAGGKLSDRQLQCPHHMAVFQLADGSCINGWQLPPLKRYLVRIRDAKIELPEPLVELS